MKKFSSSETKEKKKREKKSNGFFKKNNRKPEIGASGLHNDYVVDQTIKFAEHLAPIVIPPREEHGQVVYTVKTCNKSKGRNKKIQTEHFDDENMQRKSKRVIETFRKKDFIRESISSTNTLDDLNINQSLSCTISEQSEKRYSKKEYNYKKKKNDNKIVISESFEALATEFTENEDRKIKIHLMNEKDKNFLSDSITVPVLNAVKECISGLNNMDIREEVKFVQGFLMCNTQKLDFIMEKLAHIEEYLQHAVKKQSPRVQVIKPSTLEQLGEDLEEERRVSEEEVEQLSVVNQWGNNGCGEAPVRPTTSTGMKTDRPSRIPARFCWTDAGNSS